MSRGLPCLCRHRPRSNELGSTSHGKAKKKSLDKDAWSQGLLSARGSVHGLGEKPVSSPTLSGVLVLLLWADGWGPRTQAGPNVAFGVALQLLPPLEPIKRP